MLNIIYSNVTRFVDNGNEWLRDTNVTENKFTFSLTVYVLYIQSRKEREIQICQRFF